MLSDVGCRGCGEKISEGPHLDGCVSWMTAVAIETKRLDDLKPTAGISTCPLCGLTWVVTPQADCMVPACGHYGELGPIQPARPCEPCGLKHAWSCSDLP